MPGERLTGTLEHIVYLNNAATSWPKPPEVIRAVTDSLATPFGEGGRSTAGSCTDYPAECREALARFFSIPDPDSFIFTHNATYALNLLIHGFALGQVSRFHVITSDLEHNSVLRPLWSLERGGRIDLTVIPSRNGYLAPAEVLDAVRRDTRLAVLTQGSNVLGTVQDLMNIGAGLRDEGVFVIADGAQTTGQVRIDLKRMPVDAFVFTGHKYLFGIPGTGGFFIRTPDRVQPCFQGGTGSDSANRYPPATCPEKFEAGTLNYPGIASLLAGIRFIEKQGVDRITAHGRTLTGILTEHIGGANGVVLHTRKPDIPVISFNIEGLPNEDTGFILKRGYGIIARVGLHCAPLIHETVSNGSGSVRLSPSFMNTEEDCHYAVECITKVASHACHPGPSP